MSHINYAFNPEDDALPRDKMKLRNIASTKYSGDWPSIPHSHSYAELFYIVDGAGERAGKRSCIDGGRRGVRLGAGRCVGVDR